MFFNHCIEKGKMPHYLTESRMIPLSKTSSQFPQVGQIRTISIQSPVMKCFEKAVIEKLVNEITIKGGLHPSQRGFVKGKGTYHNIADLADHLR
jgi:hypothetical protein